MACVHYCREPAEPAAASDNALANYCENSAVVYLAAVWGHFPHTRGWEMAAVAYNNIFAGAGEPTIGGVAARVFCGISRR